MNIIEFNHVSKSFHRTGGQQLLRQYVADLFGGAEKNPFFALKDVNFHIGDGECVGVIGANGAGKSTLLSLITGLAPPTKGTVKVNGRIAALLELGAGFHQDLTGRENVILNAALMGFTRRQAYELYETIVDFAEMAEFMEEPLRTYSNGMKLRLGFSVAINLDPDILIIDEVLAVGDQAFQTKCIEKIYEIKKRGKTIFCVSHSGPTIQQLCDRALWLDHGQLMMDGASSKVVPAYEGKQSASHA